MSVAHAHAKSEMKAEASPEKAASGRRNRAAVPANPLWSVLATHVPLGVQAKLEVGAPEDQYEREADRVADQVMRMPAGGPPSPPPEDEEDLIQGQAAPSIGLLQRQPGALEEEQVPPGSGCVRCQADGPGGSGEGGSVGPSTESRIESLRGRGEPLDPATRVDFEARFGRDFRRVQVHTGPDAGQMTRDLRARAFTTRQDIYFAPGRYEPHTAQGQRLLAHELTHVAQQNMDCSQSAAVQRNNGDAQSNRQRLDEMLNRRDVPEDEVIALLGQLTASEKTAVLAGGYQARIANALNVREMVRAVTNLDPELAVKLRWIEAAATIRSQIDYSDIRGMTIAAPQAERHALKTIRWRDFFVDVCTNETMAQCVRDLGFDLETRLEWMKEEGTNWSLARTQILETTSVREKAALYDSPQMREFFVDICNDVEMAEAVVLLDGTEKQQRQWMDAEGANWTLVLGRLQYEHLEAGRRQKEEEKRRAAEEAAKKRGEARPEAVPEVTIGEVVGEEVEKGRIPTSPTASWDNLPEEQKEDWKKKRAPEAWRKLLDSVKGTELGKVMEHVDDEFSPRYALEKTVYAWRREGRVWGNVLGFGMQFVQDIEYDPKIVWPIVAHEMGGHVEYGKTYASEIMEEALDLMPKEVRERWQKDEEARQQFYEAYIYPETEIFAALRQLRYEEPPSGAKPQRRSQAIDPYRNIPIRLTQMKDRYHPEVAKAILRELKRRVDASSEILERDKRYLADQIKRIFGYEL